MSDNCIACPTEVRNLFACAHNLVALFEGDRGRLQCKLAEKLAALKSAVATLQPMVDAHFAANHRGAFPRRAPQMVDGLPRRCRLDLAKTPELAIRAAIDAVESAGCGIELTDAVVLLGQALDRVADFVERTETQS